jgi:hypothetical protein
MIRRNEGCLSCGEAVEPVLVDHEGVRPVSPERREGRSRG